MVIYVVVIKISSNRVALYSSEYKGWGDQKGD